MQTITDFLTQYGLLLVVVFSFVTNVAALAVLWSVPVLLARINASWQAQREEDRKNAAEWMMKLQLEAFDHFPTRNDFGRYRNAQRRARAQEKP